MVSMASFSRLRAMRNYFKTSEFDDIGPQYAEFWTHHSSKERATDALVMIYERVLEQKKKL